MSENGYVKTDLQNGVGTITFFHPKSNSLPASILKELAQGVDTLAADKNARVIVLQSDGPGAFCAGASFAELTAVADERGGQEFFMGFARLILAMRRAPKFVLARVHGKAVGGGVGIIAASDYVYAHQSASLKLSEFAIGIGPFVVGPAIERKIGTAGFQAMSVDTDWRDAAWGKTKGFYAEVFNTVEELNAAVGTFAAKLSKGSPEAAAQLKAVFWEGTEDWEKLLPARAGMSGRLVLTPYAREAIKKQG